MAKPIKAPVGGGDFELVPAGVYLARCYKMIDIGTQSVTSKAFGTKEVRQVIISWELLQDDDGQAVAMEDGRPFSISKTYTLSMNSKATLRKDLDSWRGVPFKDAEAADFDITNLLDKFCKLQVVHNQSGDKTYANVGSIMTTKKTAKAVNEAVGFSMAEPDMEVFKALPEWLQNKIRESDEWNDDAEIDSETDAKGESKASEDDDKIDLSGVPF